MGNLTIKTIDGQYEIHSCNQKRLDYTVDADGMTEIKNGLTFRQDKNGYLWESKFSILNATQVEMTSSVDPSHVSGKYIRDQKGNRTTGIMTFTTIMEATWDEDRLTLTGEVKHGPEKIRLKMIRISD